MTRLVIPQVIRRCITGIFLAMTAMLWLPAYGQQCSGLLDHALQVHDPEGVIKLGFDTSVSSVSNVFPVSQIKQPWSSTVCDGIECEASGVASVKFDSFPFPAFEGGVDIYTPGPYGYQLIADINNFRTVNLDSGAQLEFEKPSSSIHIRSLTLGYRSTLVLPPGDYWVDKLRLETESSIITTASVGNVRLFVRDFSKLGWSATINKDGSASNFIIVTEGNFTLDGNNVVEAQIVGSEYIHLGYNSKINGAVSGSEIELEASARVEFRKASPSIFSGLCRDDGPIIDSDGDGVSDGLDDDDDNDGYPDRIEIESDTDPLDPNEWPSPSASVSIGYQEQDSNSCTAAFVNAAQSHGIDSEIKLESKAQLLKVSSTALYTEKLKQPRYQKQQNCDAGVCYELGYSLEPMPARHFLNLVGREKLRVDYQDSASITNSTVYRSIKVESKATLEILPGDGFSSRSVTLDYKAKLILAPGDYWFETLDVGSKAEIIVRGNGTARIYVERDFYARNAAKINLNDGDEQTPSRLLLVSYDDVHLYYNSDFSGLIFAADKADLDGRVWGAVSSNQVRLGSSASIQFDEAAVWNADFYVHCDIDNDKIYDGFDPDRDGDGISNEYEKQVGTNPNDVNDTPPDMDSDGIPDSLDADRDGDGHENNLDAFPDDASEWSDIDGDGLGDNNDPDRDGDGFTNEDEATNNTDPNDAASHPDRIAPTLELPDLPEFLATRQLAFVGRAFDEYSAIASVEIKNEALGLSFGAALEVDADNPLEVTYSSSIPLQEGPNSIAVIATDSWANSTSDSITVYRDTAGPIISLTSDNSASTSSSQAVITGTVTDSGSGLQTLNIANGDMEQNILLNDESTFEVIVNLHEGSNQITILATDVLGNQSSAAVTINSDVTAPVFNFNDYPELTRFSEVELSGGVSDENTGVAAVTLRQGNSEVGVQILTGHFSQTVALIEGQNSLTFTATDRVGNSRSSTLLVNLDSVSPTVGFIPEEAQLLRDSTTTIEVSYEDDNSGIERVFWEYGSETSEMDPSRAFSDVALSLIEGSHTFSVTVEDKAGNTFTKSLTINRDSIAPQIDIQQPVEGTLFSNSLVEISGLVSDENSGIASLDLIRSNGVTVPLSIGEDGAFNLTESLIEAQNTLEFVVRDNAGNQYKHILRLTLDSIPPTLNLGDETALLTNQSRQLVNASVTDGGSGVDKVWLVVQGQQISASFDFSTGTASAVAALEEGEQPVEWHAQDLAGNTSSTIQRVNLDSIPPGLRLTTPDHLSTNQNWIQLELAVSDENSGIAEVMAVTTAQNSHLAKVTAPGIFQVDVPLNAGENTIDITAFDVAGNARTIQTEVLSDQIDPVLSIDTVNAVTNRIQLTISGRAVDTGSGLANIILIFAGSSVELSLSQGEDGQNFQHSIALLEGLNPIEIVATDLAGNQSRYTTTVNLDTVEPTVAIDAAQSDWVKDPGFLVKANISDDNSGIQKATIYHNGDTPLELSSLNNWSAEVLLSEGHNTLSVTAVDQAGNTAQSSITVGLDTTVPVIVLDQAQGGDTLNTVQDVMTLSGLVQDAGAGIQSLELHGATTRLLALEDGRFEVSLPLIEGENIYRLTATDLLGWQSDIEVTFKKDTIAPSITLAPEDGFRTASVSLAADLSIVDEGTGVEVTMINFNGSPVETAQLANLQLQEGENSFAVTTTDKVGNSSQLSATWILDTQAPMLQIDTLETPTRATTVTLSGVASDTSGVAQVLVNGLEIVMDGSGVFQTELVLQQGSNRIEVVAIDSLGNQNSSVEVIEADSLAPEITVAAVPERTSNQQLLVTGTIQDASAVTLSLQGNPVVLESGAFTHTIALNEGHQTLLFSATDSLGNSSTLSLEVELDTAGPSISLDLPSEAQEEQISVAGQATDTSGNVVAVRVTNHALDDLVLSATLQGVDFVLELPLAEGVNNLTVEAEDDLGNTSSNAYSVELKDKLAIEWLSHSNGEVVYDNTVVLEGLLQVENSSSPASVLINGSSQSLTVWDENALSFRTSAIELLEGENLINVVASAEGEQVQETFTLIYRTSEEELSEFVLDVAQPTEGALVTGQFITVAGSVAADTSPSVTVNGEPADVYGTAPLYRFNHQLPLIGTDSEYLVSVVASSTAGDLQQTTRTLRMDNQAPAISLDQALLPYPEMNKVTSESVRISGTVTDSGISSLEANGTVLSLTPVGTNQYRFVFDMPIPVGTETPLTLEARDMAGNKTEQSWILFSNRSVSMSWILPLANTELVTFGETAEVQVVVTTNSAGTHRLKAMVLQDDAVVSGTVELERSDSIASGKVTLPADKGEYSVRVQAFNTEGVVVSTISRSISLIEEEAVALELLKATPAADTAGNNTKEPLSFLFNIPIDPNLLNVQVFETSHGKTWQNRDEPGADFITARGHQLVTVEREHEAVVGQLESYGNNNIVIFTPSREFAYGSDISVELDYNDGQIQSRYQYKTKELPTLIAMEIRDQFNRTVDSVIATISNERGGEGVSSLSSDGAVIFGFGAEEALPGGDYWLNINVGQRNTLYGETYLPISINGGRMNELGLMPLPYLGTGEGKVIISSGKENYLLNGAVQLDLTNAEIRFPDGSNSGAVNLQFMEPSGLNYNIDPILIPSWMYAFQPMGIKLRGAAGIRIEMPARNGGYEYLPEEGALGLFVGSNSEKALVTPMGVVRLEGHYAVVERYDGLDTLEHIGVMFYGSWMQDILEEYLNDEIGMNALKAKLLMNAQDVVNHENE
mgnify:CR=1 FL=1